MSALIQPEPLRIGAVIKADLQALDALDSDALAVFCWSDARPLQGAAGYLDWRLCGALSAALEGKIFEGSSGEAMLLPAGGRLKLKRVFAFGLGEVAVADAARFKAACRQAVAVMQKAGVQRLVFAAPGLKLRPEIERIFLKALSDELPGRVDAVLVENAG